MPDNNKAEAVPPKSNIIMRISGVLAVIVMVLSSFAYIPDSAKPVDVFMAIFMGVGTGSGVIVFGWMVTYFKGQNTKNYQQIYNIASAVAIGCLSVYLISKSGLHPFFSIPLGLVLIAIANKVSAGVRDDAGKRDLG